MVTTLPQAFFRNFIGPSPDWYKTAILICLLINPLVYAWSGGFVAGWLLLVEFIFTLTMALKCYPLQPGGLLALEAVAIGMTGPDSVMHEVALNLDVLLLLVGGLNLQAQHYWSAGDPGTDFWRTSAYTSRGVLAFNVSLGLVLSESAISSSSSWV